MNMQSRKEEQGTPNISNFNKKTMHKSVFNNPLTP